VRHKSSIWSRGAFRITKLQGLPTPCYLCSKTSVEVFANPETPFDPAVKEVPIPLYEIKDVYGRIVLCKQCIKANVSVLKLPAPPTRSLMEIKNHYVPQAVRKSRLPKQVGEALQQMTKEELLLLQERMAKRARR